MAKPFAMFLGCALLLLSGNGAPAQTARRDPAPPQRDRAVAYYNFAMGHLYAELAGAYGNRGDYLTRAIEHYKRALKADPAAGFLAEELSDLYIQYGKLNDVIAELEEALKQDPGDLNSHRILARIYTRLIGGQQNRISEEMLKKATEQYRRITELDPKDVDAFLMLGRLLKATQNSVDAEKAYKQALALDPGNEDALTGLAMIYADLGDNEAAAATLRKVAEKNPSLRTLQALASAYEQMRDYGLAAETYRRALEANPDKIDLKRALAQSLLLADRLNEALKVYQEVVQEDAKDYQSHLRISQIHRQQRNYEQARAAAAKAKELEPDNLEVRYNEVSQLEAEGKASEAIALLKEIISSTAKKTYSLAERGNRVALLERLGLMYRANEEYRQAIATFEQIAELDKDLAPRAAAQIVETRRAAKEFVPALREADNALKKHPGDRLLKSLRAGLLADLGKAEPAVSELRTLLDGKNDREVYLTMANAWEKGKNYAEMGKAIDAAEKLSKSKEEREGIHFTRGAMFEKMKNYDAAEAEFRKALELNPLNASALNYLGYMLADRNVRLEEARALIGKALDQDPQNGAYLDSLGWVYYRLDRLPEAEKLLLQALDRARRDPTIHDHLGDVYFRRGKVKEAILEWQKSLQEWESSSPSEMDPAEIGKVQKKLEGAKVRLAKEGSAAGDAKPR